MGALLLAGLIWLAFILLGLGCYVLEAILSADRR